MTMSGRPEHLFANIKIHNPAGHRLDIKGLCLQASSHWDMKILLAWPLADGTSAPVVMRRFVTH